MKMNLKNLLLVSSCLLTLNVCSEQASTAIDNPWLNNIKKLPTIDQALIAQCLYYGLEYKQIISGDFKGWPARRKLGEAGLVALKAIESETYKAALGASNQASINAYNANEAAENASSQARDSASTKRSLDAGAAAYTKAKIKVALQIYSNYYTSLYYYLKSKNDASLLKITIGSDKDKELPSPDKLLNITL